MDADRDSELHTARLPALDAYVKTPAGFGVPAWLVEGRKRGRPCTSQLACLPAVEVDRLRAFPSPYVVQISAKHEGQRWRLSELLRWDRAWPRSRRERAVKLVRTPAHDWHVANRTAAFDEPYQTNLQNLESD